jgi:hypothetical protein
LLAAGDEKDHYQARLTFAMARHAAVDLALVFGTPPRPPEPDRLTEDGLERLWHSLHGAALPGCDTRPASAAVTELRVLYEPFVSALAAYFLLAVPPFQPDKTPVDNWQTSAWTPRTPTLGRLPAGEEHFD